jgi:ornithine cyclodeaminase
MGVFEPADPIGHGAARDTEIAGQDGDALASIAPEQGQQSLVEGVHLSIRQRILPFWQFRGRRNVICVVPPDVPDADNDSLSRESTIMAIVTSREFELQQPAQAEPVADRVAPRPATRFLSPDDIVALVNRRGAANVMAAIAAAIRADFCRWQEFDKSARVGCHSPHGVIELMPIADARRFSFKYVNGHPGNPRFGLPTVMGFGVLADLATGQPLLLSELTLTTALRTAAMSALAARELARPDSRTMALIGNGAQAAFQALAFAHLVGIETVRLFDVDRAATARLVEHLDREGIDWVGCSSAAEAARGADIVTTVTADRRRAAVVTAAMIEPGMHVNAVGGDCPGKTELAPAVLAGADVFVEYEPQTRIEGDLQQMPADFAVTELWRVFTGKAPGRRQRGAVTVFDSVGFALEDYSALRYLYDAALELAIGQPIALVPTLGDPKDLFALLG